MRLTATARPADDETATAQTITLMAAYAYEDSRNPIVRRAAYEAIGQAKDERAQLAALHRWIRAKVRFIEDSELSRPFSRDPEADEVLVRPVDLLTMPAPAGDCDDFSMLTAAMLLAIGIRPEYVTICADPSDPDHYSHVYVLAYLPDGSTVPMDTSHGPEPRWQARNHGKMRTWRIPMSQGNQTTLGAIDWERLLQVGVETGSRIATARWGQPPEGTYISSPAGTIYRQQPGAPALQFPNPVGSTNWLWIAGGLVALFLFASLAKGR